MLVVMTTHPTLGRAPENSEISSTPYASFACLKQSKSNILGEFEAVSHRVTLCGTT